MKYLDRFTSEPIQRAFLTGNQGMNIPFSLRYIPTQLTWVINLQFGEFRLNGVTVVSSVNMLRNYRNKLPFGIMCVTPDGLDPRSITDFESGYARLYLLTSDEVKEIEGRYFG